MACILPKGKDLSKITCDCWRYQNFTIISVDFSDMSCWMFLLRLLTEFCFSFIVRIWVFVYVPGYHCLVFISIWYSTCYLSQFEGRQVVTNLGLLLCSYYYSSLLPAGLPRVNFPLIYKCNIYFEGYASYIHERNSLWYIS